MKKRLKDPRWTLTIITKFSMFLFIIVPYLYFSIKAKSIQNILFLTFTLIVLLVLTIRFSSNKKDEYKLHNAINVSYAFSGLWLFFGLIFIFGIIIDYSKNNAPLSINSIILISVFLFFSFIIFYFANKSKKYEKLRTSKYKI